MERVRIGRIVTELRGASGTEPIRVGQRVFPIAILTGSALIALALLVRRPRAAPPRINRTALGWVASGLVVFVVLLEPAGFVVAAIVLFAAVARAYGPPEGGRHVRLSWGPTLVGPAIGAIFCFLVYLALTRGLDLALPAGTLWPWTR